MESSLKLVSLKSSSDFTELRQSGRKIFTSSGLLFKFQDNKFKHLRIGWTVPKYVGSAVKRNRLKRLCREVCRSNSDFKKLNLDVNVIFTRKYKEEFQNFRYLDVEKCFVEFLRKYKRYNPK